MAQAQELSASTRQGSPMSQTLRLEPGCKRRRCPAFLRFLPCHPHQNWRFGLGKPGQDLPGGGRCLEVGGHAAGTQLLRQHAY